MENKTLEFEDINKTQYPYGKLSANCLKLIALITMTLDHIAISFISNEILYTVFRIIGRLTAPIFWFFIAEGFYKTRSLKKYFFRLLLFAVISHFPFMLLEYNNFLPFKYSLINQTSVIWGLFCGLLTLYIWNSKKLKNFPYIKICLCLCTCLLAFWADWGILSPIAIWIFGTNRSKKLLQTSLLILAIFLFCIERIMLFSVGYILNLATILAIPLILLYSGKQTSILKLNLKWLFYVYYQPIF